MRPHKDLETFLVRCHREEAAAGKFEWRFLLQNVHGEPLRFGCADADQLLEKLRTELALLQRADE